MKRLFILTGIAILLFTACSPFVQVDDSNIDVNNIYTQSAMTLEAMMTQSSQTAASPTPTLEILPTQSATQTPISSATATIAIRMSIFVVFIYSPD